MGYWERNHERGFTTTLHHVGRDRTTRRAQLYAPYARQGMRLLGLSPLVDQQYAALVMMAEQLLVLGTFLVLLGASVMRMPRGTRVS